MPEKPTAPTDVSEETSWFDRIADRATHIVATPVFFLASLGLVIVWAAELMARSDVDPEHVEQLNAAVGLEKRENSTR